MNRIQLLDQATANKIAAGEVVTRPSSVIKELVENAIDAGATSIYVEIKNGGMKEIYVSDNGGGIHPDDMALAFRRHATGKTRPGDEMFGLSSLGFRGEALSSIAAVSRVKMVSRMRGAETGQGIELEGGEVVRQYPIGCPEGTGIYVNDLFYNTPARLKYIKSIGAESASCADGVGRLILAYPEISIRYSNNGSPLYHSPGTCLADAILAVYGKEIYDNLIPVQYDGKGLRVTGYIGNGTISRRNRSFQTTIVNGRVVRSAKISNAVSTAFSERMMIGKFPFYVLSLTVKQERMDANVHPQKTEIKLLDEDVILAELVSAVESALSPKSDLRRLTLPQKTPKEQDSLASVSEKTEIPEEYKRMADDFAGEIAMPAFPKKGGFRVKDAPDASLDFSPIQMPSQPVKERMEKEPVEQPKESQAKPAFSQGVPMVADQLSLPVNHPRTAGSLPVDLRIIGQAFATYLLVQSGESLMIIDQHAAHERLNYDRYLAQMERQQVISQPLLAPCVVTMAVEEVQLVLDHKDIFLSMGFDLDTFGLGAIAIRAVPSVFSGLDLHAAFLDMVEQFRSLGKASPLAVVRDRIVRACCRMSIKAGQPLGHEEIAQILQMLKTTPKLTCPHGRPIVMIIAKGDLEKNFKRIQ